MNAGMLRIEWEPCLLEQQRDRNLEAFARREMGMVPPDIAYFTPCPWLARAAVDVNPRLAVNLDPALTDAIALVVSHENSCRFCYATVRAMLRIQGMTESRVQDLEARLGGTDSDPRLAAVTAFARHMARSAPLIGPDDRKRLAEAGFGAQEYREIAFVVADMVFANRVTTIPAIPPWGVERSPQRWYFGLLRPLYARALRPFFTAPARSAPHRNPPYFARLVALYDGSPIGPRLARILDEAWASPILGRRSKALMFGVIARGLGCPLALGEARAMLNEAGVDGDTAALALDHLRAPGLSETETLLLTFARDTLWYQPATIQRRARAVLDRLGRVQFLEAVGICALANAIGRLCAAVSEP